MKCVHLQRHRSRLQRHVVYKVYETRPRDEKGERGRANGEAGAGHHTLKLIGMLMNNKLASLAPRSIDGSRDGSIAGRDSATGTLSLILLFTMPLISVIFATAFLPERQPNRVHWFERLAHRVRYLLPQSVLRSSAFDSVVRKKNFLIKVSFDRRTHVSGSQLQCRKSETRRSAIWSINSSCIG